MFKEISENLYDGVRDGVGGWSGGVEWDGYIGGVG